MENAQISILDSGEPYVPLVMSGIRRNERLEMLRDSPDGWLFIDSTYSHDDGSVFGQYSFLRRFDDLSLVPVFDVWPEGVEAYEYEGTAYGMSFDISKFPGDSTPVPDNFLFGHANQFLQHTRNEYDLISLPFAGLGDASRHLRSVAEADPTHPSARVLDMIPDVSTMLAGYARMMNK